jgi:exonuclease VII large subunit
MSLLRRNHLSNEVYTAPSELVYSVAEYVSLINIQLKPLKAAIQGEIGKVNDYPRAVYFSLFDKDKSVLNCVAWPGRLQSLGIELDEGKEGTIQGYPDIYPQTGLNMQSRCDYANRRGRIKARV